MIIMKKIAFAFSKEVTSEDIKRIRKKLSLTQAGFAQLVNVSTKTVDISFAHEGDLPGAAEVTLDLSTSGLTNGNKVYLYYFNEKTNKFELTSSAELKDGKATFTMKHCSDYVVSAEKLPSSLTTSVVKAGDNVNMVVPVLALLLGAGLVCLVCLRRRTAK